MKITDFITTAELRSITGYTLQAIAQAERDGDLPPATRIGGRGQLFWPREDMPELIEGFQRRAARSKRPADASLLSDRLEAYAASERADAVA